MTKPNTPWTPERVERLKALAAAGRTAAVIAAELGKTRNSVIARIHVLNLDWKGAAVRLRNRRTKRALVPVPRPKPTPGAGQEISRVRDGSNLDNKPPTPTPSSSCTLVELRADSCRWPLWGDSPTAKDFLYCNEWAAEGQSYCASHCLIAYAPRPSRPVSRLERMAEVVD